MFGSYRRVLTTRGFVLPYLSGFAVVLALGSVGLGLVLTVQARTGSLADGGFVSAAFGFGNAIGIMIQGRLIDRFGQTRVLVPASVCCGFVLATTALPGLAVSSAASAALVAGSSLPATISSMRVLIRDLVEDEQTRLAAYALLGASFSLAMLAGPLLVSAAVVLADPAVSLLSAAALIGTGGLAFAATPASRRWRAPQRSVPDGGPRTRLVSRGMVTLLVGNTVTGFAGGIGAVALPAAVLVHGSPALTGVAFALGSAGDILGGLAYGAVTWSVARRTQFVAALSLGGGVAWAETAACGTIPVLFALMFAGAALLAITPIAASALLDDVAPAHALTTAYTAVVGCGLVAAAAGNAVAGTMAEHHGPVGAYAVAATTTTLAACWVLARRRTLLRPEPHPAAEARDTA